MAQREAAYEVSKRLVDISVGAVALVLSIPVQLVTAGLVLLAHGRPVLFRQQRPGRDSDVFELVKFRTMMLPDDTHQTDAERLTTLGRFLRSTSLDELPTLWNVVRGDMSLVGPRPLLIQYLERYTPEENRRHEVRPGVTGLAQVAGRNSVGWEDRLRLDVEYVRRRGPALDASIMLQTLRIVLTGHGVNETGQATMTQFQGTKSPNDDA